MGVMLLAPWEGGWGGSSRCAGWGLSGCGGTAELGLVPAVTSNEPALSYLRLGFRMGYVYVFMMDHFATMTFLALPFYVVPGSSPVRRPSAESYGSGHFCSKV